MDMNLKEVDLAEKALEIATEKSVFSLSEFQLALVGGGCGEVVFG